MINKTHQNIAEAYLYDEARGLDDSFIEKVWCELIRQLPNGRVSRVVTEVALGFQNATVTAFLPILVHRRATERLNHELNELDSSDSRFLNGQQ